MPQLDAVLNYNAKADLGRDLTAALRTVEHRRIRPYTPRTNGKVARFNRTRLEEWAYIRTYTSDEQRAEAVRNRLHVNNYPRNHTAISDQPTSRVGDLSGHHN